jgi:hypothetical protein
MCPGTLVLHLQTFHGGLPVVLGGQTIAPGGFNAFVLTPHVRPSQSKEQVEIVKGSERQVNRRGLSLGRFLEITLEIPPSKQGSLAYSCDSVR